MFAIFKIDKYLKPIAYVLVSKDGKIHNISSSFFFQILKLTINFSNFLNYNRL